MGGRRCFTTLLVLSFGANMMVGMRAVRRAEEPPSQERVAGSEEMVRLESEAMKGGPSKQLELANRYFAGDGVPKSATRAAFWYERAAGAGDPVAQNMMGYMCQIGLGVQPDRAKSLRWYRLAASGGLPDALLNIGLAYLTGAGTSKDPDVAAVYFERAYEKGVGVAASYMGTMALAGIGMTPNAALAEDWYRKGVRLHDPVSEYDLGLLYSTEPRHEHDPAKAAASLREAVDSGYVAAMHSLAVLELHHSELARHAGEARELLERAEGAGYWRSSMVLGVLARDGNGVQVDPEQAYLHFRIASLEGGEKVARLLRGDEEALRVKVAATDVQRLDAEAAAWVESHPAQPEIVTEKGGKTQLFKMRPVDLRDVLASQPAS